MRNTFANFTGFSVNSLLQSGIDDDTGTGAWPHNCLAHYILVPFHNPFPRHLLHAVPIDTCYCTCCPHPHSLTAGLCGLEDEAKTWSHFINTMAERWGCGLWNVAWLHLPLTPWLGSIIIRYNGPSPLSALVNYRLTVWNAANVIQSATRAFWLTFYYCIRLI